MDASQAKQIQRAATVWVWDGTWWPAVVADTTCTATPPLSSKRSVSGNTVLVARQAKALTVAVIPEFRSKQDAEETLRKLIGAADAE